jgi:Skp family chaperone for outer membrane proteins
MRFIAFLIFFGGIIFSANAQKNVRIGFLDIDKVLAKHKGYSESSQELEAKISKWRSEIEVRQKEIDTKKEILTLESPLLTVEIVEEREEDIIFDQIELDQYIKKRFGIDGDWIKQKVVLAQPAQDEILTAIREIAVDRNLDYVFDSTADIIVLHSEKKYDISELVSKYIDIEDKKKAQVFLAETKKEERRNRTNPEAEKRKKEIEKRKAEREELLIKRKAELESKRKKKKTSTSKSNKFSELESNGNIRNDRKAEYEKKKYERVKALEFRKKEKVKDLARRKKERLEELERRKKELKDKRNKAQKK